MEILIKGEAKEIAVLVAAIQGRQKQAVDIVVDKEKIATCLLDNRH